MADVLCTSFSVATQQIPRYDNSELSYTLGNQLSARKNITLGGAGVVYPLVGDAAQGATEDCLVRIYSEGKGEFLIRAYNGAGLVPTQGEPIYDGFDDVRSLKKGQVIEFLSRA